MTILFVSKGKRCLVVGGFAVSLFAYLAATCLTVEVRTKELKADIRRRALYAGVIVALFALATFPVSISQTSEVGNTLLEHPWSWAEQILTAIVSITAFWALWQRRFFLARVAVALQVSFILGGWASEQYPFLVRPLLSLQNSSVESSACMLAWQEQSSCYPQCAISSSSSKPSRTA